MFRPHITVQNKVAPDHARRLHVELSAGSAASTVTGCGLTLWRYLGGSWQRLHAEPFEATG